MLHGYDLNGNDLGVSSFKEISGAESRVSFVGDDPVKRREAQVLRDRYSERITFKNNVQMRYGKLLMAGFTNAQNDADLIQAAVQNSVYYRDAALTFDKSKVKSGGYYHYLLAATPTHNCFVFRGIFGDTRVGGGGYVGLNRGDQEVMGGVCYPQKTKALTTIEQEMTSILAKAVFDDGALNRTHEWPQLAAAGAVATIAPTRSTSSFVPEVFATCYSPHLDVIYRAKICGKSDSAVDRAEAEAVDARLQQQRGNATEGVPFVPLPPGKTVTKQDGTWFRLIASDDMVMTTLDSSGRVGHQFGVFLPSAVEAEFDPQVAESLWPLEVGKEVKFIVSLREQSWRLTLKVVRRETVQVAAGRFETYVVERHRQGMGSNYHDSIGSYWYAPSVALPVKFELKLLSGQTGDPPSW